MIMNARRQALRFPAILVAAIGLIATSLAPLNAYAQQSKIIRDAEIETTIRGFVTPIFQAAGLSPSAVDIVLIDDPAINSFVAGGQRIYIYTGLLMQAESPDQVIGVIAHETGHIVGGHIAARINEAKNTSTTLLISYLLGLGAAFATGRGEVAAATISGAQDVALKNILSFSRDQEQRADQTAVTLLNATEQSPEGLLSFMEILGGQEALMPVNQDPYLRTHPLTSERIEFLRNAVAESSYRDKKPPPEEVTQFNRIKAKLIGFLQPKSQVFRQYPKEDTSLEARYAHAIAYYRSADLDRALPLIDGLIEEHPDDPYFHELKGQMLFEQGRVKESLPDLETAAKLVPDAPSIRLLLSQVLIESNDPEHDREALENLQRVVQIEPNNGFAWRLMATAYSRQGDEGMLSLAMAESALAGGRYSEAMFHSKHALDILPSGSPGWLRADDVYNIAERADKEKKG
jgi:predicted Zn-dependent protease